MKNKIFKTVLLVLSICMLLSSCSPILEKTTDITQNITTEQTAVEYADSIAQIPPYKSGPYVVINNNKPDFDKSELTTKAFENYAKQDKYGRCGTAYANVCKQTMPTQERGSIGSVKPTGWQTVKYDNIDGKYLYNRCHLIGYQLSAENANARNLITGTRYLNVTGMLPFENKVADYIEQTGNHVLYRVTPVFEGDNLLASGVQMEAYSVEDDGEGICFNVYCYNVQPGIEIDYATGESRAQNAADNFDDETKIKSYIVNTKSKKFHKEECSALKSTKSENVKSYRGDRENLINNGYTPCKQCNP